MDSDTIPTAPIARSINDLCVIQKTSDKGHAVYLTQDIRRGTRIMTEAPMIQFTQKSLSEAFSTMSKQAIENNILQKLALRSPQERLDFTSLVNAENATYPHLGKIRTNSLPIDNVSSGLFLLTARINHSCLPNSEFSYNKHTGQGSIFATRSIKKHEEVTISYKAKYGSTEVSRGRLHDNFGFWCGCELCTADLSVTERYRDISFYTKQLANSSKLVTNPEGAVEDAYRLLLVCQECKVQDSAVAHAYASAFFIHIAHGDEARAKIFGERAYMEMVNRSGRGHPDSLDMALNAAKPSTEKTFGMSFKWMTTVNDIPGHVLEGDCGFESWLWARKESNEEVFPEYPPRL